jgi:flagellar export protein FliJ
MRFRFSLDAVLRVAEIREECEESKLRAIQVEVAAAEEQRHKLVRAQLDARRDIAETKDISGAWLRTVHDAIAGLSAREEVINGRIRELKQKLREQQQAYLQARQKAGVTRRLRETREAEFQREVSRREQIALDDLFLNRYR